MFIFHEYGFSKSGENMGENNFKQYIDDFFDNLELYEDKYNDHHYKSILKASIDVFLDAENEYNAYEVYQIFFMIYQITSGDKSENGDSVIVSEPNTLIDLVDIMKKYEENTGDLIEKQRDHFLHSVNVFLLGLAIYSQNKHYRNAFETYVFNSPYEKYYMIDGKLSNEEFLYRWGIAALFHDVGYPVEIIGKQLNKFINDGIKSISASYDADTAIDFKDFNEFNTIIKIEPNFADSYTGSYPKAKFFDLFKPTDIMAHKIATDFETVDAESVSRHLDNFVNVMGENGFIDHGFFSSILVLNSYGYLIQKYAKNHDFFFYPIVDSATAILLHNYYRNVLQKKPFNLSVLSPNRSPIAYLLILCDELQEWNRSPFGEKDRQRHHVTEMDIVINDDRLEVDYIIEKGSMGPGFTQDKENLLKNVLSIRSIFRKSFAVFTTVNNEQDILRDIINSEIQAPNILLSSLEKLAIQIHQQYIDTTKEQYEEKLANGELDDDTKEKYEGLTDFEGLSSHLKLANIRQARSIPKKLNKIGCEIADASDKREEIKEIPQDQVIDLAIEEHDDWCKEKIAQGWTYGEERDDEKLIHNYLVPWDDLSPEIQQYDIDPILNIPKLVQSIGLKIVKSKLMMLTIEMHKFYQSNNENVVDFDDLPKNIKDSNYKQANVLVKILNELGYDVVDKDSKGETILSFNDDELKFLAKREHNEWFKLNLNLGWKYDSVRDDEFKTNPNMVEWDDLDVAKQQANIKTYRNLPQFCDNVNLKIVKF